jgi:peptide/nickel transport system permease protein
MSAELAVADVTEVRLSARSLRGVRNWPWSLRVGVAIVAGYAIVAIFAPLIAPFDPLHQNIPELLAKPSFSHLLGTDRLGRDVLSRLIYASRYDLLLAVSGTLLSLLLGTLLGVVAGYFRGVADIVVSRIIDLLLTIPIYPLLVLLLFVLGSGAASVIIAFAVTGWVSYARLARSQVLVTREQDFVAAAKLGGIGSARVMARHILPNVTAQLLVLWASDIVMAIGTIAALGYLGIGIQPPTPEWGVMVQDGQDFLLTNWWLSVAPGLVIAILGIGLALISDSVVGTRRGRR